MGKLVFLEKLVGNQDNFWNQAIIELSGGKISDSTEKFLNDKKVKFKDDKAKIVNVCNRVSKLYDVLLYTREHLLSVECEKSIWKKIKNSFSHRSTVTELLKLLDDLTRQYQIPYKFSEQRPYNFSALSEQERFLRWVRPITELPKRNKSRVPYEFIKAVSKTVERIDAKLKVKDEMKLLGNVINKDCEINQLIKERREQMKNIKEIEDMNNNKPVEGSVDQSSSNWFQFTWAKDEKGNEYSLKKIDTSNADKGTHNLIKSEILACETLQNLDCDYISMPVGYNIDKNDYRKAKIAYKISKGLLGTNFLNSVNSKKEYYKKFLQIPLGAKCFQLIMEQLIKAVETLHSKGLHHGNLSDESFKIDVEGESVDKLKVCLKIINFSYCYKIKGQYYEDDFLEHCHPVVSIIMFYYGVKQLAQALLNGKLVSNLQDAVYRGAGEPLKALIESAIESAKDCYYCPYSWRKSNLYKAMEIDVKKCDNVFNTIREWLASIKMKALIFEQKSN